MRTAGPTTGAAFTHPEFLDRALDSSAACRSLLGRDDPTNPFVARQRRQILPGCLCRRFRADGLAQVRRAFCARDRVCCRSSLTSVIRVILNYLRPNVSCSLVIREYPAPLICALTGRDFTLAKVSNGRAEPAARPGTGHSTRGIKFINFVRQRPGEPVKTIAYSSFLRIYYAILAYATHPSFATSSPNSGRGFDLAPRCRGTETSRM